MKLIKLFEAFSLEEKLMTKFRNGELDAEFKNELAKHSDFFERSSPSKEFEEEYGITGVSTDWVNPYPLTWQELENFNSIIFRQPAASEIINKIFEDLIKSNPELAMLKEIKYSPDWKYPYAGIIGGVCSSFNLSDIKDYLERDNLIYKMPREANGNYIIKRNGIIDKEYSRKYSTLYKKGYLIGWAPSSETLDYILDEVEKKETP